MHESGGHLLAVFTNGHTVSEITCFAVPSENVQSSLVME
jgi:hypothetical protein